MKAIVTTSANPLHYGHLELYNEARNIFGEDNVKIVIFKNIHKSTNVDKIIYSLIPYNINYEVVYNTTTADYCDAHNIDYIVRGIRNGIDAEYELKLDFINREINERAKTIFLPTKDIYSNISSSSINELIEFGKTKLAGKYMNEDAMNRYISGEPKYCIYFGRSCVGKTTYLKSQYGEMFSEFDLIFWQALSYCYGEKESQNIKIESKSSLINADLGKLIAKYATNEYWNKFFEIISKSNTVKVNLKTLKKEYEMYVIDFPTIAVYMSYMPVKYKSRFYLIEVLNSKQNRARNILEKKFEDKIDLLDERYLNPSYKDETINLEHDISN